MEIGLVAQMEDHSLGKRKTTGLKPVIVIHPAKAEKSLSATKT